MTLYTIGYSGRSIDELVKVLDLTGAVLVDVRLKPFSRNAQFNQKAMLKALKERYVHVPELGNLNYKGGPVKLQSPVEGVKRVRQLLESGLDVIVMCVCKEVESCHRKQVAQLVAEATGCTVNHVMHAVA